jgi:hypothetical protein
MLYELGWGQQFFYFAVLLIVLFSKFYNIDYLESLSLNMLFESISYRV